MRENSTELLDRPVYGMSRAAQLLGLRTDGLRRWVDATNARARSTRRSSVNAPPASIVVLTRDGTLMPSDSAVAFLDKVEFNDVDDVAERLFPLGRNKPIVLDPTRGFGEPTVPTAGVRTEIIAELVGAGEEPDRVAEIYSIWTPDVEQVLDVERRHDDLRQAAGPPADPEARPDHHRRSPRAGSCSVGTRAPEPGGVTVKRGPSVMRPAFIAIVSTFVLSGWND